MLKGSQKTWEEVMECLDQKNLDYKVVPWKDKTQRRVVSFICLATQKTPVSLCFPLEQGKEMFFLPEKTE